VRETNTGNQCFTVEFHGTFALYEITLSCQKSSSLSSRFIIKSKVLVIGLRCDILCNNVLQKVFWPSSLIPTIHGISFRGFSMLLRLNMFGNLSAQPCTYNLGWRRRYSDGTDGRSSIPGRSKRHLPAPQRSDRLRPTHFPIQCTWGALSMGAKPKGHEADHSPPSTARSRMVELRLHAVMFN
jgi:hypothetical protein